MELCCVLQRHKQQQQQNHRMLLSKCACSPPTGVQPLPLRQRFNAGQRLLQETGGQEVAQYGKPELHEEVHQAVEWRMVDAGHHSKGI